MNNQIFKDVYLFSDIDGTFASEENFIPKKNLDAIEYFTQNGGTFSIATGRYIGDLDLLDNVNINGLSIINNGASIYDFKTKKEISSITLNENDVKRIFEFLEINTDVGLLLVNKDGYTSAIIDELDRPIFHDRYKIKYVKEISLPFNKMLLVVNSSIIKRVLNDLTNFKLENVDFVQTGERSIEIVPKNINKGTAFLKICKDKNIDIKNTYFIGDSFNDVEFMKIAGTSAAVGEAKKEVKENAKIIMCDFKNGAVAEFIEYIKNRM